MSPLRLATSVTPAGQRIHSVDLVNPGVPVADGDGGYTQAPTTLATVRASIEPATARDLERVAAGTVLAQASHVVRIPYFASGVTTQTRVVFGSRILHVLSVANPEEKSRELVLVCAEVVA